MKCAYIMLLLKGESKEKQYHSKQNILLAMHIFGHFTFMTMSSISQLHKSINNILGSGTQTDKVTEIQLVNVPAGVDVSST